MSIFKRFVKNEDGGSAVEYALMAAMMAAMIIVALTAFSTSLASAFTSIGGTLTTKAK